MAEAVQKKSRVPHVFALMFIITILMAVLTWLIPAGEYERVKEGARTVVVANSFKVVDSNPRASGAFSTPSSRDGSSPPP